MSIDNEIKEMAEKYADTCFAKGSFRWQKVVQYYTKGINDWVAKKMFEDLASQEDKPPFSMPPPIQEPFK